MGGIPFPLLSDYWPHGAIGKAYGVWTRLLSSVGEQVSPLNELWGFTSASTGWGLRVRCGDAECGPRNQRGREKSPSGAERSAGRRSGHVRRGAGHR